jgi:hypothetical protein
LTSRIDESGFSFQPGGVVQCSFASPAAGTSAVAAPAKSRAEMPCRSSAVAFHWMFAPTGS